MAKPSKFDDIKMTEQVSSSLSKKKGSRALNYLSESLNFPKTKSFEEANELIHPHYFSPENEHLGQEILASLMSPQYSAVKGATGVAAKYLVPLLKNSAMQGGIASVSNPETALESGAAAAGGSLPFNLLQSLMQSQSPALRIAAKVGGGVLGGGLGYLAGEELHDDPVTKNIALILGGLAGSHGTYKSKLKEIKTAMEEYPQFTERMEAGRRQGIDLRPAEVLDNPEIGTLQGEVERSPKSRKIMYKKGKERLGQEENAIKNFFDTIFNPKDEQKITELYNASHANTVPQEFIDELHQNKIIQQADKLMNKEVAFQERVKDIPKDSVQYYDELKKKLYEMEEVRRRKGNNTSANTIAETRQNMVKQLDDYADTYAEARRLYEDKATREGIENVLNRKDLQGTNFYHKVKDPDTYNELAFHLRDNPIALQHLKDLKLISEDLLNPPTIRTARGTAKSGADERRNAALEIYHNAAHKFLNYMQHGANEVKLAQFMTNPNWDKEIDKMLKLIPEFDYPGKNSKLMQQITKLKDRVKTNAPKDIAAKGVGVAGKVTAHAISSAMKKQDEKD